MWLDERPSYTLEYILPYIFGPKYGFSLMTWQKCISKQRNSFLGTKKENLSTFSFKSNRISLFPTFKHEFLPTDVYKYRVLDAHATLLCTERPTNIEKKILRGKDIANFIMLSYATSSSSYEQIVIIF
jgi:hypothetical protein